MEFQAVQTMSMPDLEVGDNVDDYPAARDGDSAEAAYSEFNATDLAAIRNSL